MEFIEEEKSLAVNVQHFISQAGIGDARLASLVNDEVGIDGFLHRSTIRNWRNGASKSVKDWRQLAAIASALELSEGETDSLLFAGGCPSVQNLLKLADEGDRAFLARWETESQTSQSLIQASPDVLLPDALIIEGHKGTEQYRESPRQTFGFIKILVPLLLVAGVLYGVNRWRMGESPDKITTVFSEQNEGEDSWNITMRSWNSSAEPIQTELAVDGEYVLNVSLEEYGGVTFFNPNSSVRELTDTIQFYVRRADVQTDKMSLVVVIDNDDDFQNGEIGRLAIDEFMDSKLSADSWTRVSIPLKSFATEPFKIAQLAIHSPDQGKTPHFWLDRVYLASP